ncbi:polyprenyl synthetase family protein [Liquorilactobacillus vini]|uniref:Farnesyl diphosphate synthase n=2 Tax=Liquorilactobacillus vini TaxID=238015 RepID=A0A0R2C4K1_9LACO|nr:farnesyl diphosphate synthase [Liquorilactobacillus vini]KRM86526.1 Geranylgeranyl pyrophosphate synthase [Liquorilactobacillus vini DSM 20605]
MIDQKVVQFEKKYRPQLEQHLSEYLQNLTAQPYLLKAMTYSVMAGGKRIRPMMILAICQSFERKIDQAVLDVAGSLELLHTYSLIHDDLPEMDNDDLRRGVLTNHKKFGQATAVLAGDGLLTTAFEWLTQTSLNSKTISELVGLLAHAAGVSGMVSGQMSDILGEQQRLNLRQLKKLHQQKTGALILYACQAGAILAGIKLEQRIAIENYGRNFGLAFQIYDDLMDELSTTAKMGKKVHKDQNEHKNTYPSLLGISQSWDALTGAVDRAANSLKTLSQAGVDCSLLQGLLTYFSRKEEQ